MKIFYHSADPDGKLSGFLVGRDAEHYDKFEKKFMPITYGVPFPFDEINVDEQVYIVDYSILPEEMERLKEITSNIVWIDHHKSAIEEYNYFYGVDGAAKIRGIRYDGIAACALTFIYFNMMNAENSNKEFVPFDQAMYEEIPHYIKLVSDYDVWTFEFGEETRNFHAGLMCIPHDADKEEFWCGFSFNHNMMWRIIQNGISIRTYRSQMMADYCKSKGFETQLAGHKAFAINMAFVGSDDFASINTDEYDLLIGFSFDGYRWSYSLRSEKVDCSQIAKKFGGGGHRGAAGFSTTILVIGGTKLQ